MTAAVRNMPANRNRAGDPPPALYSPECVEGEFSEVRPSPNERSSSLPITKITRRVQDILQTLKEVDNMNGGKGIYVGGTLLSILISLALYATGRRESAIFVGLWAPTILNLGQSLLEKTKSLPSPLGLPGPSEWDYAVDRPDHAESSWPHCRVLSMILKESCEAGLPSLHALSTLTDRVPARTPSTSTILL